MKMGIKNVFKWRVTTNKYLYLTDEENQAPFILDKRTGDRTYPQPISGSTVTGTTVITGMTLDEGLISQTVSNIKSADSYSAKYDKMVALVPFDNDTSKLTFLEYDKYFNLDEAECVEEAVTPKCEGYEPVFNVSAYTLQNSGETEVEYTFYAERNEADKTLRYNLDLGIPRGEKGEKGDDGIGCKGDKGDDGLDAIISNVEAEVKTLEPYEEPVVSVISSRTEDNEYDLKFWFKLPSGEEGKQGPVGDDGPAGWDAIVKNVTATASALMPGSTPTVDVTNFHINQNGEEHINETSFNLNFKIPRGEKGSQGDNGLNAEIRTVTAEVIETKEAGYWVHDEESGTDIWVDNDAEAGVVVTPAGGGNVIDLAFWFKIPRGRQGEKGDPGDGGGSDTGGWMYNFFDPQFIPTPGLEIPIGDWDVHYHQALAEADVKLQIYYPEDWGGGGGATCDDDCRKHRYDHYQNNSDSLSEGMVQVINGVVYPLATAQGTRSHAEGIGMELPPYSYVEVKVEGNCSDDYNITIPKNAIPAGIEFDDIVGLQLYLNSEDVDICEYHAPDVPAGVDPTDFYNAIKNAEMTIVSATLVSSEDEHLQFSNVNVEYTISGRTYQSALGYLIDNSDLYDNRLKLNFVVNPPDAIGVATHTEGRACQAIGDYSHAEGWDTLARGPHSHTEGLGTYTTNLSEHAEGQYNVSHSEDRTEFNNSNGCSTVSSIGIGDGDEDRKNAIEVMQNGDVYIYGVGNYDGTEVKCDHSDIQTLQDVLSNSSHGTVTNIATGTGLTGGPITSSGTISHADTSSQASVTNTGRSYIQSVGLDGMGHVTSLTSATETVVNTDTKVTSAANHYGYTSGSGKASGLYKIATDDAGHVTSATAVVKSDITALGIPGTDTNTWRPVSANTSAVTANDSLVLSGGTNVSLATGRTGTTTTVTINANVPDAMEFKGTLGNGGTITVLPTDGSAKKGDTYKVITDGTYAGQTAKVGDLFICNGKTSSSNTWVLVPSGDEPSGTVTNIATGTGLTGGPITSSGTISHADTSSQSSVTNTGRSYIQSVGLDGMGHVTSLTSATETVVNTDTKVTSAANHYGYTSGSGKTSGLYKIATDDAGHVTSATAVVKADITALGIPGTDTDTKVTSAANHYGYVSGSGKASGLYKVATDNAGHVTSATAVVKSDITALGIPGTDTNTWRPVSANTSAVTSSDSLVLSGGTNVSLAKSSSGGVTTVTISASGGGGSVDATNDNTNKLYLVGAKTQTTNPDTKSNSEVYETAGKLHADKLEVGIGSATGANSVANGYRPNNVATLTASGQGSHAEGYAESEIKAAGNGSHAEGKDTSASGDYSHAEGVGSDGAMEIELTAHLKHVCQDKDYGCDIYFDITEINDKLGTSFSTYSDVTNDLSLSLGHAWITLPSSGDTSYKYEYCNLAGKNVKIFASTLDDTEDGHISFNNIRFALNPGTNIETVYTLNDVFDGSSKNSDIKIIVRVNFNDNAVGSGSHTEGGTTVATGDYSHAEGWKTLATGIASHAEGYGTIAHGDFSNVKGCATNAGEIATYNNADASIAQGYATNGASIYCDDIATFAQGYATNGGYIESADSGAFVGGYVDGKTRNGGSANLESDGPGTLVYGYAKNTSGDTRSSHIWGEDGALATGYVTSGGHVEANNGSACHGYATTNSQITTNEGAFAAGYAKSGATIEAGSNGSFAAGYASYGVISANSDGACAHGFVTRLTDTIWARQLTAAEKSSLGGDYNCVALDCGIDGNTSNWTVYSNSGYSSSLTTISASKTIEDNGSGIFHNKQTDENGNLRPSDSRYNVTVFTVPNADLSKIAASTSSGAKYYVATNGEIRAVNDGSTAIGYAEAGTIHGFACGAFAQGYVTSAGGAIEAGGDGSFASGKIYGGGNIYASSDGAFAQGYTVGGSTIGANSTGAFAHGVAENGGIIEGNSDATFTGGFVSKGSILNGGTGGLVHGYIYGDNSVIENGADGCLVHGYIWGSDANIYNNGAGSFVGGSVESGSTIGTNNDGVYAHGYAHEKSVIYAVGPGAHAEGYSINNDDTSYGIQIHTIWVRRLTAAEKSSLGGDYNCVALNDGIPDNSNGWLMFCDSSLTTFTSVVLDSLVVSDDGSGIFHGKQTDENGNLISADNDVDVFTVPSNMLSNISTAGTKYYLVKGILASGEGSHAEGCNTIALGNYSHAEGFGTVAYNENETVVGKFNIISNTDGNLFVVGNGIDNKNRSNAFSVNESGNCYASGAYYASSDARKKDIVKQISLDKAYELVEKCQTIFYTWKDDTEKQIQIGLLAQEVQEYFPELVSEGSDGYLTLDYSKLTVILLTVIKDLTTRVKHLETLEERIKLLEKKLK